MAYTENDDWWPDTGTDKNYTNAFRVTLDRNYDMWRPRRLGRLFQWVPAHVDCADVRPIADPFLKCASSSWHIVGQQFYTPDDITVSELIPNDRPYAGWLYIGGAWKSISYSTLVQSDVYFGLTGEGSLAKPVQTFWHKLVGASKPQGWANQIGGRVGIVIGHNRTKAFELLTPSGLRWLEFTPYVGGTAGNIITDAYVGARLKLGFNLSRDWSQIGIAPRVNSRATRRARTDPPDAEVYLVVDGQGRGLAYDAFIDAAPKHDLDRKPLVADGGVGIGFRFRRFGASYRVAFVSPEYQETLTHDYKALRFTIAF